MQVSVGRIVLYALSQLDAEAVNVRRSHAANHLDAHRRDARGVVLHVGNVVHEGDQFPAVVVRVWDPSVNLQVLLDGTDTFWATSRSEGEGPGTWAWPPRV